MIPELVITISGIRSSADPRLDAIGRFSSVASKLAGTDAFPLRRRESMRNGVSHWHHPEAITPSE